MNRPPELERFVELFNAGEYWESHEALEPLWLTTDPPLKELYRGLIQAAAAMVHWQRQNQHGIRVLGGKARAKLLLHLPDGAGLDLQALVEGLDECLNRAGPPPVLRWLR